jgi:hypothetical protein
MGIRRKLYWLAGGALAAEVVTYLLWRPRMLRWGATDGEVSEPLPGDDRTPRPRVQSTRAGAGRGPGGAYGGVLLRGAGLPAGVVPAAAPAGRRTG